MAKVSPIYGQMKTQFWRKPQRIYLGGHTIGSVKRALSPKFPDLNFGGLAAVKNLSINFSTRSEQLCPNIIHTDFHIMHEEDKGGIGIISFSQDKLKNRISCTWLYPDLPRLKALGATLFSLLLLRSNTFAGRKVIILIASDNVKSMANSMRSFNPVIQAGQGIDREDVVLTVPKLSEKEVSAVEWFWLKVLRCFPFK